MAKIDELLQEAVDGGGVPGAVAMSADRDGVASEGAAGALSVDGGGDVGPDTMFRIASMTKAVTTVAALRLIEQGRLTLDQRVTTIRPEFGNLQVLDGFDGDRPRLRPPTAQATIRQLMTHTAGPGYWFTNAELVRFHEATGVPTPISGSIDGLIGVPLVDDPGSRWEYGTNTDWLGLVIETIGGRPLDEHLQEFVLGPLGMKQTTFRPDDDQRARLMPVHARQDDGALAVTDMDWPTEPDYWPGGHGLYATASDYLRFLRMLLGDGELDGERILQPESVELMLTDQTGGVAVPHRIEAAMPEFTNDVMLPEEIDHTWGAGLHLVLDDLPGMRRANSGDWAGIFNSYYWLDRASGVTGVVFTQVLPFFDPQVLELAAGFEAATYEAAAAAA